MHLLYNIGIHSLGFVMRILGLFSEKSKSWVNGRKSIFQNLPSTESKNVIWFHCASLGEFDQGLPLMEIIKKNNPDCFLLITFFSPSGMQHYHKRDHLADHVMYLPLDTVKNAKKFINHFKPSESYFVKYEFWSNYIFQAKIIHSKLYNISGIFREKHRFFKWYGGFFRKTLHSFDWFFVQNEKSKNLLKSINIECVSVSGDSRYDRVIDNKKKVTGDPKLDDFCNGEQVLIIGSSWPADEKNILNILNATSIKAIIAPHNVDSNHIKNIINKLTCKAVKYTKYQLSKDSVAQVLILDTIGQLSNAYSYGKIAYVGGGFSGALHNILEPAVFGIPVIFGPKHHRFPEAQAFIDNNFGFSIENQKDIEDALVKIENDLDSYQKRANNFIEENTGASQKIYDKITSS
ncbi:MAG: 3-deoxy-D-manno-octulosonic acid transferase [Crocinitomicaceae bacterium]|nr:3-deoxy-D-manno-octulosonic acid transferase [Crocinitomicaceae bacterium]